MELFDTTFLQNQLFWTGLAFVILLGVMWKYVVPAITETLDKRAEQISGDLFRAESLRKQAEESLANYETQIREARSEAANMVTKAREEARAIVEARTAELEAEISRKSEEARSSIEHAKAQALKEVQTQVAELAINVAEKIIAETIDAKKAAKATDSAVKELLN